MSVCKHSSDKRENNSEMKKKRMNRLEFGKNVIAVVLCSEVCVCVCVELSPSRMRESTVAGIVCMPTSSKKQY